MEYHALCATLLSGAGAGAAVASDAGAAVASDASAASE
jgi:hypothetical protein